MRILHTSDWHVGKRLGRFDRMEEHGAAIVLGTVVTTAELVEACAPENERCYATSAFRARSDPEDGQRIDAGARNDPEFLAFQAETRRALYQLSAELKRAVPFFHPRYVGHMSSDLLLPGLVAKILKPGYGRAAAGKDYADVHTTLWLYDEAAADGRGLEIWSSGGVQPFQFQLDAGQVISGWDLGVKCMLVGEKRELRIAPELGYGARGKPPVPPQATLLFEIELVRLVSPDET